MLLNGKHETRVESGALITTGTFSHAFGDVLLTTLAVLEKDVGKAR